MAASPASGVNTLTGEGLAEAIEGASVVVDVSNAPSWEDAAVMKFFETSTCDQLASEVAAGMGHHVVVTQLLSKDLTDLPNKEGLMITVEYPPGGSDPIHRHNAHVFVYVLEGSVVMQVKGGKEIK